MQVEVIRMRDKGVKLERAQLRECSPVQGDLAVTDRFDAQSAKHISIATLVDTKTEYVLPVLDYVLLTKLRGDTFVLVGIEEVLHRKQVHNYPQSWWVRPVVQAVNEELDNDFEAAMIDAPRYAGRQNKPTDPAPMNFSEHWS